LLLRRTAVATLAMSATAATVLVCFSTEFSSWIFGRPDCTALIGWLTAGLLAVISFNFMIDVFTGLRMQRIASQLQTVQALSFATIGLALLAWYPQGAQSVVIAYGGASLLAFFVALPHLAHAWRTAPRSAESMPQTSFWGKLMPYAVSLWAANWLSNAFLLADRYLIIHYSGMSADDALSQVGQYHTARLVPILILTFAGLLSSILLPHLSYDWETGCRRLVCDRMNLFLKGLSLALLGSMAALLLAAPWLFRLAFGDKFDLALTILPWTIGYCVWASLGYVVRTYLWCD
jgi:O-antigen/teichoic acid export membrane protein